jgi:hypothetical protein
MSGTMRRVLVAALGAALLAAAGFGDAASAADHGKPVIVPAPAKPPAMERTNGVCTLPGPSNESPYTTTERPLLWLRAHPTGVVAVWIPGLNSKRCAARRTTNGTHLARRTAAAIRQTAPFPPETLWCPNDDGARVRLHFAYRHGGDEYADIALGGCRPISAPGRAARWTDAAVTKSLREVAPRAWRTYLGT